MLSILNAAATSGTDYGQFKVENQDLAMATKTETISGRDITFLSLCEIPEYQEPNATTFFVISDATLRDFRKYGRDLKRAILRDSSYPAECVKEMKQTTGLMFLIGGEKYLVSQHAMATLSMQASISGTMTLQRSNFLRDMHLADALFYKNDTLTIVYREIETAKIPVKKVYAVFAGAYKEIPQTVVANIADAVMCDPVMGNASVNAWYIDHELTRLEMSYPKIQDEYTKEFGVNDITPGVMIQTSDVGDSAIRVFGTQRVRKSYVITEEITAKHTQKNTDVSKIIEAVDEKIFFDHRKLPELLAELIGKEVAADDLDALVEDSIMKLLKSVLSKRHVQALIDAVMLELDPTITYTLYDIAVLLMELPERIVGIDDSLMLSVRKALASAPTVVGEKRKIVYLTA